MGADFDALSITGLEPMIAERYIWPARERQEALLRTCNRRTEQECCALSLLVSPNRYGPADHRGCG